MMEYDADFSDAHERHWKDAELLFSSARWANADQLYGFSAECGLKAIMKASGIPFDHRGPEDKKYWEHIQDLWPMFMNFADSRIKGQYRRDLPNGEPFADWSQNNRYASSSHFHQENVEPHQKAAQEIRLVVKSIMRKHQP